MTGRVSLVGAGPGDPELLTRRAERRLREADVVLYDALVPIGVLDLAPHARRFCVGKRAGRPSTSQATINQLLIQSARRGARVVRLKGGDPFLFGRGGEEMLALRAAGVRVEIVPGVSSALAAPALAGIPVTHRGTTSGLLVVTGHAVDTFESIVASVEPLTVTVVVLMGLRHRDAIASRLIAHGWPPTTPVAVIAGASTPAQAIWRGRLGDLPAMPDVSSMKQPATLVVGRVVAISNRADAIDGVTAGPGHAHVAHRA